MSAPTTSSPGQSGGEDTSILDRRALGLGGPPAPAVGSQSGSTSSAFDMKTAPALAVKAPPSTQMLAAAKATALVPTPPIVAPPPFIPPAPGPAPAPASNAYNQPTRAIAVPVMLAEPPAPPPAFVPPAPPPPFVPPAPAPAPAATVPIPPIKPISASALPTLTIQDPTIPKFEDFSKYDIVPDAARFLSREFCEKRLCCILGKIPSDPKATVALAMVDPSDETTLAEVVAQLGRRLHPIQFNAYEVKLAIARAFGGEQPSGQTIAIALDFARKIEFAPDQAPSAMLDDLLSVAIQYGASDVHIETYAKDVDLRFRKGGVLRQVPTPISPDNVKKVVSRIKILSSLDIAAKPQPMDGRFSARYANDDGDVRTVHFRVSIVPTPRGEDVVLRVMDPAVTRRSLDELGVAPAALQVFRTLLRCPAGLILVTGPTGSGKTTTLYGALRDVHSAELKICTVEDPIEYLLPRVNQFQVDEEIGFAHYARALLRHDPDVIMIGEIRDPETAQVAVRAASTGHLVLSTVHTDDAVAAVTRMRMLGIDDELLSATLLGATAQRLVRRNCVACKVSYTPAPETLARFYQEDPRHAFMRGKGCKACHGTGFTGQFGLFEVFACDDAISAPIGKHATLVEIRQRARERGFVPLVEQALERVRAGETTLEEVERTVRPIYLA